MNFLKGDFRPQPENKNVSSTTEHQITDFYRRMHQTATFYKHATFLVADRIARETEMNFVSLEQGPTSRRAALLWLPRAFWLIAKKLTTIVFRRKRGERSDRNTALDSASSAVIDVSPSTHFYDPVTPSQEDFPTRHSNCDDAVKERSIDS